MMHRREMAARKMLIAAATETTTPTGKLRLRDLDRVHARTGVPWKDVRQEAVKAGVY